MDPIPLARELVQIDSPTGQEGAVGDFLAQKLGQLGYDVRRQEVSPGRWNLYALREPPVVVFSTHIDTVPPNLPFREDQTHLHGRGTADAKGIVAVQVAAAERLAACGMTQIALLYVVGEEYGSDGARAAAALAPKGKYLINGEPTDNRLALGTKGALLVTLSARGRAAHSAYPEEGISAIDPILEAIHRIRQVPLPHDALLGESTLNVGTIDGGVRPNVIPESCQAELLFRTVQDTMNLRAAIREAAENLVDIEFTWEMPLVRLRPLPGFGTMVARYGTDLPFLEPWGERQLLGPGSILVAHTEEERVSKHELVEGVALYERLVSELVHRGRG